MEKKGCKEEKSNPEGMWHKEKKRKHSIMEINSNTLMVIIILNE